MLPHHGHFSTAGMRDEGNAAARVGGPTLVVAVARVPTANTRGAAMSAAVSRSDDLLGCSSRSLKYIGSGDRAVD